MIVDAERVARAKDPQHAIHDPVASRIRVLAGDVHRRQVVVRQRSAELNRRGRGVHAVVNVVAPFPAARQREEAGRGFVPEAARAEVNADPESAVGTIFEQVDIVVAAAHGSKLRSCEIEQRPLVRHRTVRDRVEHRSLPDRLVVLPTDAEGDRVPDLVHDVADVEIGCGQVGADGAVPAADVIPNARRHHNGLRREDAADRHRVAFVMVRAEHAARFITAFLETSLELRARIPLNRPECDQFVAARHTF
jgi:hypothetical protein